MAEERYGRNQEWVPDPTPTTADKEMELEMKRIAYLVHVLHYVADGAGYNIMGRMILRDKKTGREYR